MHYHDFSFTSLFFLIQFQSISLPMPRNSSWTTWNGRWCDDKNWRCRKRM